MKKTSLTICFVICLMLITILSSCFKDIEVKPTAERIKTGAAHDETDSVIGIKLEKKF